MRLDEGPEPGFPQYIRQASIAVQLVVALDQALALQCQALRQEAEVRTFDAVGNSLTARVVRIFRFHDIHRFAAPRRAH